jgi:hypothetical protein
MTEFTESEIDDLRNALDSLGLALTNHDHQWTAWERKSYEKAMNLLDLHDGMRADIGSFGEPK